MTRARRSGTISAQMRRARFIAALTTAGLLFLATAPAALANNGGEGWYGETNDVIITNAMFGVILFFVLVVSLLSLIQWRLDVRKHRRMDAKKRAAASADPRGGW